MIRYDITLTELKRRIREEDADWLDDADERTQSFRRLTRYEESSTIWRRVVRVYMRLQHNKCAFCERKLEDEESGGTREFDIEHFRPKSSVKSWPTAAIRRERNLPQDFPNSDGEDNGYYLLAYHVLNYSVACKPCNSSFKSNYFPVAEERDISADHPRDLRGEQAYLVYPISNFDSNPESILKFDGVYAVPATRSGRRHDRARVIVAFFDLNNREEHLSSRAEKVSHMFLALEQVRQPDSELHRTLAERAIEHLTSPKSSHTNCCRSFRRLYESNRPRAEQVALAASALMNSES